MSDTSRLSDALSGDEEVRGKPSFRPSTLFSNEPLSVNERGVPLGTFSPNNQNRAENPKNPTSRIPSSGHKIPMRVDGVRRGDFIPPAQQEILIRDRALIIGDFALIKAEILSFLKNEEISDGVRTSLNQAIDSFEWLLTNPLKNPKISKDDLRKALTSISNLLETSKESLNIEEGDATKVKGASPLTTERTWPKNYEDDLESSDLWKTLRENFEKVYAEYIKFLSESLEEKNKELASLNKIKDQILDSLSEQNLAQTNDLIKIFESRLQETKVKFGGAIKSQEELAQNNETVTNKIQEVTSGGIRRPVSILRAATGITARNPLNKLNEKPQAETLEEGLASSPKIPDSLFQEHEGEFARNYVAYIEKYADKEGLDKEVFYSVIGKEVARLEEEKISLQNEITKLESALTNDAVSSPEQAERRGHINNIKHRLDLLNKKIRDLTEISFKQKIGSLRASKNTTHPPTETPPKNTPLYQEDPTTQQRAVFVEPSTSQPTPAKTIDTPQFVEADPIIIEQSETSPRDNSESIGRVIDHDDGKIKHRDVDTLFKKITTFPKRTGGWRALATALAVSVPLAGHAKTSDFEKPNTPKTLEQAFSWQDNLPSDMRSEVINNIVGKDVLDFESFVKKYAPKLGLDSNNPSTRENISKMKCTDIIYGGKDTEGLNDEQKAEIATIVSDLEKIMSALNGDTWTRFTRYEYPNKEITLEDFFDSTKAAGIQEELRRQKLRT